MLLDNRGMRLGIIKSTMEVRSMVQHGISVDIMSARVKDLKAALDKPGIECWGHNMDNLLQALGGRVIIIGATGCKNDTCYHVSHDPYARIYKWIPDETDKLIYIGYEGDYLYYALIKNDMVHFIQHYSPRFYHGRVDIISMDKVPDYLLINLNL